MIFHNLGSKYLFIKIYLSDKLKEQFPEVDFGVIPGINDPEDPQSRTNFAVFMSSLIIGMIWITYITFFNSRAVGRIVTSIANRFVKSGYIKVSTILKYTIFTYLGVKSIYFLVINLTYFCKI